MENNTNHVAGLLSGVKWSLKMRGRSVVENRCRSMWQCGVLILLVNLGAD